MGNTGNAACVPSLDQGVGPTLLTRVYSVTVLHVFTVLQRCCQSKVAGLSMQGSFLCTQPFCFLTHLRMRYSVFLHT
jgi:hypothetical protein